MGDFDDSDRDDDFDDEDIPETLPAYGFTLTGMECLNEECIRAVSFIRNREGIILDIEYALTKHTVDTISAPFERFDSHEAYLTLMDDDENRKTVIVMNDLTLQHMELAASEDSEGDLPMHMSFDVKTFKQQIV